MRQIFEIAKFEKEKWIRKTTLVIIKDNISKLTIYLIKQDTHGRPGGVLG